jgi:hypothetical protein
MFKRLFNVISGRQESCLDITEEQKKQIGHAITLINWERLQIFLLLTLGIEILLILGIDLPSLSTRQPGELWMAQSYLVLHTIISLVALSGVLILRHLFRNNLFQRQFPNDYLTPILGIFLLAPISMIAGLDQIKTNQITAFIINLMICGGLVLIKPPWNFFSFTIPFLVFAAGMFMFQSDPAIRTSHLVNGGILLVAVLILSKILYDNQFNLLIRKIKLEEANQKLLFLSRHDPLTNLSNRRNFEEYIKRELNLIKRYHQESALILMDLDHFKNINDQYGHLMGDKVLHFFIFWGVFQKSARSPLRRPEHRMYYVWA